MKWLRVFWVYSPRAKRSRFICVPTTKLVLVLEFFRTLKLKLNYRLPFTAASCAWFVQYRFTFVHDLWSILNPRFPLAVPEITAPNQEEPFRNGGSLLVHVSTRVSTRICILGDFLGIQETCYGIGNKEESNTNTNSYLRRNWWQTKKNSGI